MGNLQTLLRKLDEKLSYTEGHLIAIHQGLADVSPQDSIVFSKGTFSLLPSAGSVELGGSTN
jgi:hypothetical protein